MTDRTPKRERKWEIPAIQRMDRLFNGVMSRWLDESEPEDEAAGNYDDEQTPVRREETSRKRSNGPRD